MSFNIISSFVSTLSSLLGITAIIVFHEFGHFVFCKIFNVYTPTFSIGMGKVLYSKLFGHTNFCISAAPIGGYVEIATEEGIDGTKGFNQIPYWQKVCIMLGGISCNFLFTYIVFAALFFTGMPESGLPYETNLPVITQVSENSINATSLQPHDVIESINGKLVSGNASILKQELLECLQNGSQETSAVIQRNNESIPATLKIDSKQTRLGQLLNVSFEKKPSLGAKDSLIQAYSMTQFCLSSIIQGLKNIFSSCGKGFVGPIMAVVVSSKSAQKGFSHLLLLLAIISINLGFMNLLPLPIFDGGQFVLFSIEAATGRALSDRVRELIGLSSWILAIGLMIIFSLRDIYTLCLG